MFDNTKNNDSYEADRRLRKNLRRFDRNSLKILHPLFRDALRLLAQRHQTDKRETLLLPLVSLAPPVENVRQKSPFTVVTTGHDQSVHLHH